MSCMSTFCEGYYIRYIKVGSVAQLFEQDKMLHSPLPHTV